MIACKECAYYYAAKDEAYARCHFERMFSFDLAPCEQEDEETEEEEND